MLFLCSSVTLLLGSCVFANPVINQSNPSPVIASSVENNVNVTGLDNTDGTNITELTTSSNSTFTLGDHGATWEAPFMSWMGRLKRAYPFKDFSIYQMVVRASKAPGSEYIDNYKIERASVLAVYAKLYASYNAVDKTEFNVKDIRDRAPLPYVPFPYPPRYGVEDAMEVLRRSVGNTPTKAFSVSIVQMRREGPVAAHDMPDRSAWLIEFWDTGMWPERWYAVVGMMNGRLFGPVRRTNDNVTGNVIEGDVASGHGYGNGNDTDAASTSTSISTSTSTSTSANATEESSEVANGTKSSSGISMVASS